MEPVGLHARNCQNWGKPEKQKVAKEVSDRKWPMGKRSGITAHEAAERQTDVPIGFRTDKIPGGES